MTDRPPVPTSGRNPPRLDVATAIIAGTLGVALVAGYVVLAALGRDVTGYVLFLGGPAVTGIVGILLSRRVTSVQEQVDTRHAESRALVRESVSAVDEHLSSQDVELARVAATTDQTRRAIVGPTSAVPGARSAPVSPFGPVRAGMTQHERTTDDGS